MRLHVLAILAIALACRGDQPVPAGLAASVAALDNPALVLRGTLLTPDGVIKHGYVGIADPHADELTPDKSNHVPWNVLPRWNPGRTFTSQPQWADDPEFRQFSAPFDHLVGSSFCDMNAWGELRALVGGTTSTMATRRFPCIHGLVRNLDLNSGFYGTIELDREHIFNVAGFRIPPPADVVGRAAFVQTARFLIATPFYEALALHVAEGTDAYSEEQFTFLETESLLNPKGVLIHGISLGESDFQAMATNGTALVWSPCSNLEPDWAITGSSNMLDELKTAAQWNREHLGGRLSDRQLVDMVTSVAAHVAGVDDEVGAIRAGLRADLVVLTGDHNDPYGAVIAATPADVQLVVIAGQPLYGDRKLMERFWDASQLEEILLPTGSKTLAAAAAGMVVAQIAARLRAALQAEGTSLAPLVEP